MEKMGGVCSDLIKNPLAACVCVVDSMSLLRLGGQANAL